MCIVVENVGKRIQYTATAKQKKTKVEMYPLQRANYTYDHEQNVRRKKSIHCIYIPLNLRHK